MPRTVLGRAAVCAALITAPSVAFAAETFPQTEPVVAGVSCDREADYRATSPGYSGTNAVRFINQTSRTLEFFWLNYDGARVYFYQLGPNDSYLQETYPTHAWLVADRTDGTCLGIWRNSQDGITAQARITGVIPPTPTTPPETPATPQPPAPAQPTTPTTPTAPVAQTTPAPTPSKRVEAYVRFRAKISRKAVEFIKLVLVAPRSATVEVSCKPRCQLRRIRVGPTGAVSLLSLVRGRKLRPGSRLELTVTRPQTIGRFFRYTITPTGIDGVSCLVPADTRKRRACTAA